MKRFAPVLALVMLLAPILSAEKIIFMDASQMEVQSYEVNMKKPRKDLVPKGGSQLFPA